MDLSKTPNVKFGNGFLGNRVRQTKETIIPYQWKALNDQIPDAPRSHAIENFRIAAGLVQGEFYGFVFQDSDVAKWLEAVGHILAVYPDPELERTADEVIDLIAKAQWSDGYLNTYYTINDREKRWTNLRDNHELYCAGHMIEAAVVYFKATGKRKFLDVVCRLADHIASVFGPGPSQKRGYPGHPEIELALIKLYRVTGKKQYLELSRFFVEERGKKPLYFEIEAQDRGEKEIPWSFWSPEYCQAHLPVREQKEAVGHAVRAMYLYCAVADLARETGDHSLFAVCKDLWQSVITRRMYITGGIGSSAEGESFTFDYDLPGDRAYSETCAGIGLFFWGNRMLNMELDSRYADVMERVLYNVILSGVSLDGTKYFYTNPLEVWPEAVRKRFDLKHVVLTRQPWFDCACCPPNIARFLASVGQYFYSQDSSALYAHLFGEGTMVTELGGVKVTVSQETDYPWWGEVAFRFQPEEPVRFTFGVRIPGWCRNPEFLVNGKKEEFSVSRGYALFKRAWKKGDEVMANFPMQVERVKANPLVRYLNGRVAITRGPIVYCIEEKDHGADLSTIVLPQDASFEACFEPDTLGGVVVIKGKALREKSSSENLYNPEKPGREEVSLRAIPYYAWGNRGEGEMTVWIREG